MKNLHLCLRDLSNNIIAKVHNTKHRFISLYLQTINAKCLKVNVQDDSWFWHMRFGYLNFEALKSMGDKNIVDGIPSINDPNKLCDSCLLGEHAMRSFPEKTTLRTSKPLQLVHTDVCGPIDPPSFGKRKYFLLFIDDLSRKTLIYFLKQNFEVFVSFKNFIAIVENESGYEIKVLRSDKGGEFTSKEFNNFCQSHGIRLPLTVPYSPQQHGVSERKSRKILNMARCMLKAKHLPKEFWAKLVSCAIYLSNRSLTRNVRDQTP